MQHFYSKICTDCTSLWIKTSIWPSAWKTQRTAKLKDLIHFSLHPINLMHAQWFVRKNGASNFLRWRVEPGTILSSAISWQVSSILFLDEEPREKSRRVELQPRRGTCCGASTPAPLRRPTEAHLWGTLFERSCIPMINPIFKTQYPLLACQMFCTARLHASRA